MNGRGLFDRYMDDNTLRLLSEDIEEVYDFPRKADDSDIPEDVKSQLVDEVNKITKEVKKMGYNPDEDYTDENIYNEFKEVSNILTMNYGYQLYSERLSAIEQLNPRIIVKRIADSDLNAIRNGGTANAEGISTKLFNAANIERLRQGEDYIPSGVFSNRISDTNFGVGVDPKTGEMTDLDDYDINKIKIYKDEKNDYSKFMKDFIQQGRYGTGENTALFKSKYTPRTGKEQKSVAVPVNSVEIGDNGKIKGSGNFTFYTLEDGNKIGEKVVSPVGRFNTAYTSANKTFKDEATNTEYYIFNKETSADYIYGYFRDRENDEDELTPKETERLIGGNEYWMGKSENARNWHEAMVQSGGRRKDTRKLNQQYYPFTFNDYFFVKVISGTYVCIRVVTAQSKVRSEREGQYSYTPKRIDVVYLEGYVLEIPPPSTLEGDKSMSEAKVIRYIDDTIRYISVNKNLDPRRPDYKGNVADPNKYWVKMDSSRNASTIMLNTLNAIQAIYRHMDIDVNQPWVERTGLKSQYQRAEISLGKPDYYDRVKKYMAAFLYKFQDADWSSINGIEAYVDSPKIDAIVGRWCIRQLEILKILIENKREIYSDRFKRNPRQFWDLAPSDVRGIQQTEPSQDQAVMETIRRRLLEYCN